MSRVDARAKALLTFLAIAFLDEFVDGVASGALPVIRSDLALSYVQIGMLLSIPGLVSVFAEPVIGILGDAGHRKRLILAGGIAFGGSLALASASWNFMALLVAWIFFFPASGAFVSLSQASLMDNDLLRHAQNMARWTLIGSFGNLMGPIVLTAAIALAVGWRGALLLCMVMALPALAAATRLPGSLLRPDPDHDAVSVAGAVRTAIAALRRFDVVRWQVLLQASDLMLDLFKGFLALYMVDVAGVSESSAALALAVWIGAGLLGELLVIPLFERVRPLRYLGFSVLLTLILYPAFLLATGLPLKLLAAAALGLSTAGWYSVLQGQAYSSLPRRSGTVVALGNLFGISAAFFPLGLGVISASWGLAQAMWVLLIGPIAVGTGLLVRRSSLNAA